MNNYKFYKESDGRWYVDLPEWPGSKAELEMVSGTDTMLDILSQGEGTVELILSESEFDGADSLTFIKPGDLEGPELGEGAWYNMEKCQGIEYNLEMWLCDVTKFVFGDFPKTIWLTRTV